jgi:hypothetical protein
MTSKNCKTIHVKRDTYEKVKRIAAIQKIAMIEFVDTAVGMACDDYIKKNGIKLNFGELNESNQN